MGLIVLAPPCTLAEDIILVFNAAKIQEEIVSEPNFCALEDANAAFLPAPPTSDSALQRPAVQKAWANPALTMNNGQYFMDFELK
jgi:hypothetical protein